MRNMLRRFWHHGGRPESSADGVAHPMKHREARRIIGNVDGYRGDRFCGWVIDRFDAYRRMPILIEIDGRSSITAVADRYRADLHKVGLGDGYAGFAVPATRLRGARHVRVLSGSPACEIPSGGNGVPAHGPSAARLHRLGSYKLRIDGADVRQGITGWAFDSRRPQQRCLMMLRQAPDQILARQCATLYRSDIGEKAVDGFHGFAFAPVVEGYGPFHLEDATSGFVCPLVG